MAMRDPAEYAEEIERDATLPAGPGERFSGYGVMGLPFRSGHILGLRRFSASSIGPGYRSVWHRAPNGRWTFYQDQPAELACTRYFGAAVDEVREGPIEIAWTGPRACAACRPRAPDRLRAERTALRRQSAATMGCAREWRPPARRRPRCDGPRSRAGATERLRDPSARCVRRGSRLLRLR